MTDHGIGKNPLTFISAECSKATVTLVDEVTEVDGQLVFPHCSDAACMSELCNIKFQNYPEYDFNKCQRLVAFRIM